MPDPLPGRPRRRAPLLRTLLLVATVCALLVFAVLFAWGLSHSIGASVDPAHAARSSERVPPSPSVPQAPRALGAATADDSFPAGVVRLDSLLEPIRARAKVPALACAIVRGDSLWALGVVGVRRAGAPEPARWYDRFHIGSDTKAMTAMLVATLIEEGRLRWNSTLAEVFSDLAPGMRPEYREVTIEMLMQHRSGLPDDRNMLRFARLGFLGGSVREQRLQALRSALAQPTAYPPGTRSVYANMNFGVLGAVVERLTGDSWESQMRRRLFAPLGMSGAGFGAPHTPGCLDQPWGHAPIGPRLLWATKTWLPPATHPAGNVSLSMSDWAKFAALHLAAERGRCHLLSRESFRRLHAEVPPGSHFAAGWGVAHSDSLGTALEHAGSDGFWYAVIVLSSKLDAAILIATNVGPSRGERVCDDAFHSVFRLVRGAEAQTKTASGS